MTRALIHAAPVNVERAITRMAAASLVMVLFVTGCSRGRVTVTRPARIGSTEQGLASWYGVPYNGRATASGEIYDMEKLTAAHKKLPFQTWVEVTNLRNGKQVNVRITDRGPFVRGRIIDLSLGAAREIDMVRSGTERVRVKVIPPVKVETAGPVTPGFAVQAGAFGERRRAEALREALHFQDVRIVEPHDEPRLWRVVVGRDLSKEDAEALASQVRSVAGAAIVVPGASVP